MPRDTEEPLPFFERVGPTGFRPTGHVTGAWSPEQQHIGPALGLLAHLVERDRDRRRDDVPVISRLSYDILGPVPMEPVEVEVTVRRPGRTIELVEAVLVHAGRPAVLLRAWLVQHSDTGRIAGGEAPTLPAPEEMSPWDPTTVWPGGYIASAEVRRVEERPGRARFWVRTRVPLLPGEAISPTARAAGLLDIANGMTVRADPAAVGFPNVDLTAHLHRQPCGEWVGFDTTVSFGPTGQGVTGSVLHDAEGPVGTLAQTLMLRPLRHP